MIPELIIANTTVLILILIALIIKNSNPSHKDSRLEQIKEVFGDDVEIHKIPKFEDDIKELEEEEVKPEKKESEEKLIASPSSKRYHKTDCRLAKTIKKKETGSLKDFQDKGYSPCGICMKK